jgi:hypothetical protein
MGTAKDADILQAIDDQHSKNRRREISADILDKVRCLSFLGKDRERKNAGCVMQPEA